MRLMRQTNCKICDKSILVDYDPESIDDPVIKRVLNSLWSQVTCGPCATQAIQEKADRDKAARQNERLESWRSICPLIYQETDPTYPTLCKKAYRKTMAYQFKGGKGLVLGGDSRSGKTRSAFDLLRREYMAGRSVKHIMAASFSLWNRDAAKHGLRRWESEIKRPDILFIDDVGKAITGDGRGDYAESQFWAILETRFAHGLPVVLTIQQSGEQMQERMSGEVGKAFVERIREFCDQIKFETQKGEV